jgi:methylmalonyl-CoA mutase C-terminal domain/subunit
VIVAKPGLDGHDRGARVIARALRDAGMEVIYTGLHQTPAKIVAACRQEDPDVLCLSILSGAHMTLIPLILEGLREQQLDDIPVLAGGIIPDEDARSLLESGVSAVLGPGTSTEEIIGFVRELAGGRRRGEEYLWAGLKSGSPTWEA